MRREPKPVRGNLVGLLALVFVSALDDSRNPVTKALRRHDR